MAIAGMMKRQILGQITANGSTEATLTVTTLETDSIIIYSLNTVGGTPADAPFTSTKNTTTNTIGMKAAVGDTSIYDVILLP